MILLQRIRCGDTRFGECGQVRSMPGGMIGSDARDNLARPFWYN